MSMLAYVTFLLFCYLFRGTLLPPTMAGQADMESGLPPAQPQYSGDGGYAANGGGFTDIGGSQPSTGVL
jgi:hypothetical protein